jgi:hypothetical protein
MLEESNEILCQRELEELEKEREIEEKKKEILESVDEKFKNINISEGNYVSMSEAAKLLCIKK